MVYNNNDYVLCRFRRPFVKRFALYHRTAVLSVCPIYLSVCPVCDDGVLSPNGSMDQDETWHAGRPQPWPHCVRRGPSSPSPKRGGAPNFRPISVVAKWLDGSRCHLEGGRPQPKRHCVRWGPSSLPKRGRSPQFSAYVYYGQTAGRIKDGTWYGGPATLC